MVGRNKRLSRIVVGPARFTALLLVSSDSSIRAVSSALTSRLWAVRGLDLEIAFEIGRDVLHRQTGIFAYEFHSWK